MTASQTVYDCPPATQVVLPRSRVAPRSFLGLNATNFFVAEIIGVVLPFLTDFLREQGWRYDAIGVAASMASLGVFVSQTPAGMLIDRIGRHRSLLALSSLILGLTYGVVPLLPTRPLFINPMLFLGGIAQAFLAPLLAVLALNVGGHGQLNRIMGANQAWNHVGNIATALLAMALVTLFGIPSVFYATTVTSLLASLSVFLVARTPRNPSRAAAKPQPLGTLWRDQRVIVLLLATGLFHLANAPAGPLLALYTRHLSGSHAQVAGLVFVSQAVMIPVAFLAGRLGDRLGRKPVLAFGFATLPLRCVLCAWCTRPEGLLLLQVLDGVANGIYGVVIASTCADLGQKTGHFNTLMGMATTALALGAVIGPGICGVLVERLGFAATFRTIGAFAAVAAALFVTFMRETHPARA